MVDRNIVNKLGLSEDKLNQQVEEMFSKTENEYLEEVLQKKVDLRLPGTILQGTIVTQIGNDVIVEVGLKSEGIVDAGEFDSPDEVETGKEIQVFLEDTDSESGLILLSKRKADVIRGWETIINTKKEGDSVKGRVIRRIKGGLLVDIGVPVFLPASQVDIRKPGDISRFIGKEVECKILKIDVEGRNIVISRRKLVEEERRTSKEKILSEIEVGQRRKGVVKNIADFGVFVDLGGLDGLLHISDLSWGRISHPSEVVELDQEIECIVIGFDREHEKISLGLKQKTSSPWEDVEQRYPIGARVRGKVVNVMNYGAFVRLEDGIEGLVHISEMSWTRRLAHPGEMVNLGDEIEVVVLSVNKDKQEISLGLKQTEVNPWSIAAQKYPAGTVVGTKVRSVTNFGVFVEIEPGIDGMVHISDLSWTRKYSHPSEALQKGQEVKCVVLEVNEEKRRVSLGIKQMTEDPWIRAIPEKYIPGHIIKGKVAKLTNFGAFVELEQDLEGLLHISELADHKIDKPQDIVNIDDEIEVKILKVDSESRKIGLSLRRVQWAAEDKAEKAPRGPTPTGIQSVLSDSDLERLSKKPDEVKDEAVEESKEEGKPAKDEAVEESKVEDKAAEGEATEESKEEGKPAKDEAAEESKVEDKPAEDEAVEESKVEDKAAEGEATEESKEEGKPAKDEAVEESKVEDKPAEDKAAEEGKQESEPVKDEAVEENKEEYKAAEGEATEESKEEDKAAKDEAVEESKQESKPAKDEAVEESKVEDKPAKDEAAEESKAESEPPAEGEAAEESKVEDKPAESETAEESEAAEESKPPAEGEAAEESKVEDKPAEGEAAEESKEEDKAAESKAAEESKAESEPAKDEAVEESKQESKPAKDKAAKESKKKSKAAKKSKKESEPAAEGVQGQAAEGEDSGDSGGEDKSV